MTVGEALNIIRREGVGERVIYFYIINDEGQLAGIIPTRRLLTATIARYGARCLRNVRQV